MSKKTDRRKVMAVLAGGLVLGVGAAVTLAAWNDSEFATGTFGAGQFNLEGSTTSATTGYDDHNVDEGDAAASLAFTLPLADNLTPGDVVYAPFWVRLAAGTTTPASLTATAVAAGTGGNEANLSYSVYAIAAGAACNASATTGSLVASGSSLSAFTDGADLALAQGADAATPGAAQQLCFVVTAGTGLVQGANATATWSFTATSS
ncbi:SipW-dependent-type signal peptide-containing protein [Microbacterium resistens]|uniref:SipW-dependent-type signal peptide-containing protein n=1 Tax=Microbacterium resistens TaxID=156977 RepID=A0ABY3RRA3_9MICO|nr:SipW-dependent-type signal peptide-containing protein [Microbacterium resistens]UGS26489.1 SipW-dependent-type signal peptide-containing protein [Microbacterium resistens]